MMIADVNVPDTDFSPEVVEAHSRFLAESGESPRRAVEVGVERLNLPLGLADEFRLYASVEAFRANPYDDEAARQVAFALDDAGRTREAAEMLEQMELVGRSSELWYEHPLFLAGWMLADDGQHDAALDAYHRLMKMLHIQPKAALLAHVGSVFHEVERFDDAIACYERAARNWQDDRIPEWMRSDLLAVQAIRDFQIPFIDDAIAAAREGKPFTLVRSEDGLRNRMGDVALHLRG